MHCRSAKAMLALLAAVGFIVGPLPAQAQNSGRSGDRQQSQNNARSMRQDSSAQRRGDRTVRGRITDLRTVRLRGEQEKHLVAKLRLDSGGTAVVDLGRVSNLRDRNARFRVGDRITAGGRMGTINRRPVLAANRVRDDRGGPDLLIVQIVPEKRGGSQSGMQRGDRGMTSRNQSRASAGSRGQVSGSQGAARGSSQQIVLGRLIDEVTTATIRGLEGQRRLLKLQGQGGRTIIVEAGKADQIRDIRLQKGELLSVIGRVGRLNGRTIVIASEIGDLMTIDRSADRAAQRLQQQKRQQQQQQGGQSGSSNTGGDAGSGSGATAAGAGTTTGGTGTGGSTAGSSWATTSPTDTPTTR